MSVAMCVGLLLAGCGSSSSGSVSQTSSGAGGVGGSATLQTVTIALPTGSALPNVALLPVGVEKGFFSDQGIDLKVKYLQGGTAVVSAVQAGQADLALTSPEPLVLANSNGGDLVSVYQLTSKPIYEIGYIPGSAVQSLSQLSAAKIGVVSAGNVPTYKAYLDYELAKNSLPPVKTANMVPTGEGASAAAAVQSGQVDALFLTDTGLATIRSAGVKLTVKPLASLQAGFPGLSVMARKSVIATKGDAIRKTLAGLAEAAKYCVDQGNACMDEFAKIDPAAVPDINSAYSQWAVRSKLYAVPAGSQAGKNDRAAWKLVETLQQDAGLLKSIPTIEDLYTNELL